MTSHPGKPVEEWATPRTVVVLTLLLLGALWTVVVLSALVAREDSLITTAERLQRASHAVEEQTRLQMRLATTALAACEQWLRENPARAARGDAAFRRLVEQLHASSPGLRIGLLARGGRLYDALADSPGEGTPAAGIDHLLAAARGGRLSIGVTVHAALTGKPALPVVWRLAEPAGEVEALLAVLDLSALVAGYEPQHVSAGGTITLARSDGVVLAIVPRSTQPFLRDGEGEGKGERVLLPGGGASDGRHRAAAFGLVEQADGTSPPAFVRYASMIDLPLVVVVAEEQQEALASWWRQTVWLVLLTIGMTVPLLVVAHRSIRLLRLLAHRSAEVQQLSTTDPLTGASNRQHFLTTMENYLQRARREGSPFTLMLVDIDFFQRINDGYGRTVGDQVLTAFVAAVRRGLREADVLGRLGGGDFGILLPHAHTREALRVAERIRCEIAEISIASEDGVVEFSASTGIAEALADDASFDAMFQRASQALRAAQAAGHDCVRTEA